MIIALICFVQILFMKAVTEFYNVLLLMFETDTIQETFDSLSFKKFSDCQILFRKRWIHYVFSDLQIVFRKRWIH